ncbi:MAG: adenylate/guanylate cyclase domain-containing protein [Actinomycetota bacterium]
MPPETHYAKGHGGLIAYQTWGRGPDLVYINGSVSHVDVRWESPRFTQFLERLGSFSRVITFDRLGTGASDPIPAGMTPTWEEWTDDLRTVLDAVGSTKATIFAMNDAAPMALLFAAAKPERTTSLVIGNGTARWLAADDYACGIPREAAESLVRYLTQIWGTNDAVIATNPLLANDPMERAWFAKYMRASSTPRMMGAHLEPVMELDLRAVLPTIRVPALIFHRRAIPLIPFEQGRYLADNLADAKFVELEGSDTGLFFGSDAEMILDTVEEFVTGERPRVATDRALATVLFTDLVGATQRAVELGDRSWRDFLDRHDEVARRETQRHRGRVWKTTGDGVLATFETPGRAIRCALSIQDQLGNLGAPVRAGLHTGEVELRHDDIGGIAAHIAARVMAEAGPGETLVSSTVKDLVAGSDLRFVDRGPRALKGLPDEWRLFAVEA